MDTQNDGLEKVDSCKIWPFLVSMLDFWGVTIMFHLENLEIHLDASELSVDYWLVLMVEEKSGQPKYIDFRCIKAEL